MRKKRSHAATAARLKLVRHRVSLSQREEQVLRLLTRGFSNKEIAACCALSVETVKEYVKHIYSKFGIHGRTALLAHLFGTDKL